MVDQIDYTVKPEQKWEHFQDDVFRLIIMKETYYISNQVSLNLFLTVRMSPKPSLVQVMA